MNETADHRGRYSITWKSGGNESVDLLHYALPHHQVNIQHTVQPNPNFSQAVTRYFTASPPCL